MAVSKQQIVRGAALAVVVVAFGSYGVITNSAAAQKAENIANAANSGTRGEYLKDGTFTGTAPGYGGTTEVEVTVTNGYITNVEVTKCYDDAPYLNSVKKQLIPELITDQTTTIDVVTNASYSSNGVRYAVRDALRSADSISEAEEDRIAAAPTNKSEETDTLSIGYLANQSEKEHVASTTSGFAGGV